MLECKTGGTDTGQILDTCGSTPLSMLIEEVGVLPWGAALTGSKEVGYRHMIFGTDLLHLARDGFLMSKDEERC